MDPKTASLDDIFQFLEDTDQRFKGEDRDVVVRWLAESEPGFNTVPAVRDRYRELLRQDIEAKSGRIESQLPAPVAYAARSVAGLGAGAINLVGQAASNLPNVAAALGLTTLRRPAQALAARVRRETEQAQTELMELGESVKGAGIVGEQAQEVGAMAVASMPPLLAALTGNFPAAFVTGGAQEYAATKGQVFDELMRQGKSELEAEARSELSGISSGVATAVITRMFGGLERFIAGTASGKISASRITEILRPYLKGALSEGLEEGVQGIASNISSLYQTDPEFLFSEEGKKYVIRQGFSDAVSGLKLSLVLGPLGMGGVRGRGGIRPPPTPGKLAAGQGQGEIIAPQRPPPIPTAPAIPAIPAGEGEVSLPLTPGPGRLVDMTASRAVLGQANLNATADALEVQNSVIRQRATTAEVLGRPNIPPPPPVEEQEAVRQELERELYGEPEATQAAEQPQPQPAAEEQAPAQPVEAAVPQQPGRVEPGVAPATQAPEQAPAKPVARPRKSKTRSRKQLSKEDAAELDTLTKQRQGLVEALIRMPNQFAPEATDITSELVRIANRITEIRRGKPVQEATQVEREVARTAEVVEEGRVGPTVAGEQARLRRMNEVRVRKSQVQTQLNRIADETEGEETPEVLRLEEELEALKMELEQLQKQPTPAPAQGVSEAGIGIIPGMPNTTGKVPYKPPTGNEPYSMLDFIESADKNQMYSQPFGMEKIPLIGKMFGGAARVKTEVDASMQAYMAEKYGVAPAIAGLVSQRAAPLFKPFTIEGNRVVNVLGNPVKGDFFQAMMANPDAYPVNPDQAAAIAEIKRILDRARELGLKYGVLDPREAKVEYFPHIVEDVPEDSKAGFRKSRAGAAIGSEPGFAKARQFKTEAEGMAKGYKYVEDPHKALSLFLERLYSSIADQRLIQDPTLGGKTQQRLKQEMRAAYAPEIAAGTMTDQDVENRIESRIRKGTVYHPGFFGMVFDPETAEALNAKFPRQGGLTRKVLLDINNAVKFVRLGYDLGAPFIQGLPLMFKNPALWGQAVALQWKALLKPGVMLDLINANPDNLRAAEIMAQSGSSVTDPEEYLAGGREGSLLSKVPYVSGLTRAHARAFATFINASKLMLFRSQMNNIAPDEVFQMVRQVETELLSSRMESAGVSRGQAILERLSLLAPSFYRGALNQVAQVITADTPQTWIEAFKSISTYIAGTYAAYAAFAYLASKLGWMDEDEVWDRMNPASGKYLTIDIPKPEGGGSVHVGFGGVTRSLIRLMAKTFTAPAEDWKTIENWPPVLWYRYHAAPLVSLALGTVGGVKTFEGNPTTLTDVTESMLPLWIPSLWNKEGPIGAATGYFGLLSYPESAWSIKQKDVQKTAQELFGKGYENLKPDQLAKVNDTVAKMPIHAGYERTAREREASEAAQKKRASDLWDAMKPEHKQVIEDLGLRKAFTSYSPQVTINGTRILLSPEMRDRYNELMVESYVAILDKIVPRLSGIPETQRIVALERSLEDARKMARGKWISERN